MNFRIIALAGFTTLLFGCATYHDPTAEDAIRSAENNISKNDRITAGYYIEMALDRPDGSAKVHAFVDAQPIFRSAYLEHQRHAIATVTSPADANRVYARLVVARKYGILPADQISALFSDLNAVVVTGAKNGSIPFDLSSILTNFPDLKSPEVMTIIIDRSISAMQNNRDRHIASIMDYVAEVGVASTQGKKIEAALPRMNIRQFELKYVAPLFPEFARNRKEAVAPKIFLQVKGGDRLFFDDVSHAIQEELDGVEFLPEPGQKVTTLVIERLRHEEKINSDRTETITYSYSDVDIVNAVLLMPKNASFIYDVVSSSSQIDYGYVVTAKQNNKTLRDEVVRGVALGNSSRCLNAHVQNVFGGSSAASFVANSDMQRRCSNSSAVSIDDLRRQVMDKVMASVFQVPTIKIMKDMN